MLACQIVMVEALGFLIRQPNGPTRLACEFFELESGIHLLIVISARARRKLAGSEISGRSVLAENSSRRKVLVKLQVDGFDDYNGRQSVAPRIISFRSLDPPLQWRRAIGSNEFHKAGRRCAQLTPRPKIIEL